MGKIVPLKDVGYIYLNNEKCLWTRISRHKIFYILIDIIAFVKIMSGHSCLNLETRMSGFCINHTVLRKDY